MKNYSQRYYDSLNKSKLTPPGYVFSTVWPILYILLLYYLISIMTHKKCRNVRVCYPLIPFWFYVILIFSSTERIERGDDGYGGILRENTVEEIFHDLFFARRKAFFNMENYKENSLHYAQVKKLIEIIKG